MSSQTCCAPGTWAEPPSPWTTPGRGGLQPLQAALPPSLYGFYLWQNTRALHVSLPTISFARSPVFWTTAERQIGELKHSQDTLGYEKEIVQVLLESKF